jgi:hypothetical protein
MKRKLFTPGMFVLASALVFTSCEKETESGNTISYQANPINFTSSVGASVSGSGLAVEANANSSITWTEGTLNIQEIDFEAKKDGTQIEYEYKNLVNVSLAKTAETLGSIQIPDGTYNEVELKLEFRQSSSQDIPVRLKGTYTDLSGAKTPIELQFNEDIEIKVESEDLVMEADEHIARINMQLNKLLSNISVADLTMATKTNGTIVISNTSNTSIYSKIKASLDTFADCKFED